VGFHLITFPLDDILGGGNDGGLFVVYQTSAKVTLILPATNFYLREKGIGLLSVTNLGHDQIFRVVFCHQ
jgi:hypothetical protein